MARILRLDPVTVLAETSDLYRAARDAAAMVYVEDDKRQQEKQAAQQAQKMAGR